MAKKTLLAKEKSNVTKAAPVTAPIKWTKISAGKESIKTYEIVQFGSVSGIVPEALPSL